MLLGACLSLSSINSEYLVRCIAVIAIALETIESISAANVRGSQENTKHVFELCTKSKGMALANLELRLVLVRRINSQEGVRYLSQLL